MKESREQFITNSITDVTNKLNVDIDKEYSVDETLKILKDNDYNQGLVKFVVNKPHTGGEIIANVVHLKVAIMDAIHKNMGCYEDAYICEECQNYFKEKDQILFQVETEDGMKALCTDCRRKLKIQIRYYDFIQRIEDKEEFMKEESKFGIDYSDYAERLNRRKTM